MGRHAGRRRRRPGLTRLAAGTVPPAIGYDAADALRRTASRYRRCDRFTRHYVASKLRMDPVHAAVLALAAREPFGRVMDLGCGRGQLGVALLEAGLATNVLALDHDAVPLAQLGRAAAGLPLRVQLADLAAWQPHERADTVLLVDVLYQLSTGPQLALLQQAAASARRTVVIRATDPARAWRSALSTMLERLGRGWWPTFGARSNPLPPARLAAVLTGCGFSVVSRPCAEGTPLAGMLLVGRRAI